MRIRPGRSGRTQGSNALPGHFQIGPPCGCRIATAYARLLLTAKANTALPFHLTKLIGDSDLAGRSREEIAKLWVKKLTTAIRKVDDRHMITVGVIPWARLQGGQAAVLRTGRRRPARFR